MPSADFPPPCAGCGSTCDVWQAGGPDRISGTVGADGLIAAAYKVALAHHRFWTRLTSLQVRNVVAQYQAAETGLLTLRVEYMHAHPEAFSGPLSVKIFSGYEYVDVGKGVAAAPSA